MGSLVTLRHYRSLFSNFQHGFSSSTSTLDLLIVVADVIAKAMIEGFYRALDIKDFKGLTYWSSSNRQYYKLCG